MSEITLRFVLDGVRNRTLDDWRRSRLANTAVGSAKKHAKETGYAGVWRADDSFVLFYMESGKLKQRTWASAGPVR